MVVIKYSREYNIDAETMWKIVGDFSNVHKVHPAVKTVDQLTPQGNGEGAIRRCNFYDGGHADEEIKNWDANNMSYDVHVLKGTIPFKTAVASFVVESLGEEKSKVSVTMDATVKYGPIGVLMGRFLIKSRNCSRVSRITTKLGRRCRKVILWRHSTRVL